MTSTKQDEAFAVAMSECITQILCGSDGILLEAAIEGISSNLTPDDIFSPEQMKTWAADSGYVEGGEQ